MKAINVMSPGVISVGPQASIKEVAQLMVKKSISAVPVLDDGRLVGIVTEGDLLRRVETGTEMHRPRWLDALTTNSAMAAEYTRSHSRKVADVMTREVVTVADTAELSEIANLLESKRIKRVPVLRDGKLVGIVSRANLIQALAVSRDAPVAHEVHDQRIREALLTELGKQRWAEATSANVVVNDGVVHLWGVALSQEERDATRVAAENTKGVRQVVDHIVVQPLRPAYLT